MDTKQISIGMKKLTIRVFPVITLSKTCTYIPIYNN